MTVRADLAFQNRFTMAFQPIVDIAEASVFAHEALVRSRHGEPAAKILFQVDASSGSYFDRQCRLAAMALASQLSLADTTAKLSINTIPSTLHEPFEHLAETAALADHYGFPRGRVVLEFRDTKWLNVRHTTKVLTICRDMGFQTVIDNFGPTPASLEIISKVQPDFVKLDRHLVGNIDTDGVKLSVVKHALGWCRDLDIRPICVCVETPGELATLTDLGVDLIQGFLFARPAYEHLAMPQFQV